MKAFVYLGPGAQTLEDRPIPELQNPPDALLWVVKTTICGTDLHILKGACRAVCRAVSPV